MMRKPNFLAIGPTKSGSTSLFHYLLQHPDIYLPPIKNPKYFYGDWEKYKNFPGGGYSLKDRKAGIPFAGRRVTQRQAYLDLFENVTSQAAIGEVSPGYITYEGCAERIHQFDPNMKLVAILRNPVERAYSHFMHANLRGRAAFSDLHSAIESEDLNKPVAIEDLFDMVDGEYLMPDYIRTGLYYKSLLPFYNLFGANQIHVVLFEDFLAKPALAMESIFEFLAVDSSISLEFGVKYNVTGEAKSKLLDGLIKSRLLKKMGALFPDKLRAKGGEFSRGLKAKNKKSVKKITVSERKLLYPYFEQDIEQLEGLIGRNLAAWKTEP